ncbi:MAG TPA: DUF6364 family protein [Candidatus Bathyarchaeia archaeon]|nr:DUF6364 family protein [Candidatus Bathyarchaeia archaeon]
MQNRDGKQNITLSLNKDVLRKAKVLAARRDTSISGLLTQQIEALVGQEEAYERARSEAMKLLEKGFHLGGTGMISREELHER